MHVVRLLLSSALFVVVACGGSSSSSGDPVEKSVVMYEELGKAIDGAGDDCARMAAAVEGVITRHEGTARAMKAMVDKAKGDEQQTAALKKRMEPYEPRMKAATASFMKSLRCADDPAMKAVEERLEATIGG